MVTQYQKNQPRCLWSSVTTQFSVITTKWKNASDPTQWECREWFCYLHSLNTVIWEQGARARKAVRLHAYGFLSHASFWLQSSLTWEKVLWYNEIYFWDRIGLSVLFCSGNQWMWCFFPPFRIMANQVSELQRENHLTFSAGGDWQGTWMEYMGSQ